MVNALIKYSHPTNWSDDNADVLKNVLADIEGLLNVQLDIKLEPEEGNDPAPWIMGSNRILLITIAVLLFAM